MKIGYPCINRQLSCRGNRTFRLKSYTPEKLIQTVEGNLTCLKEILRFNLTRGILFFRITSDLIPFASHPVCTIDWASYFEPAFNDIGDMIRHHGIRISMHPDQFTLINSPREDVFRRSVHELSYHARVLDLMGLDRSARIQIHVGGVYGDKEASVERFAARFTLLPLPVRNRLVVENDDRHYHLGDCLRINKMTGIPILFDVFHHQINPVDITLNQALEACSRTWRKDDGLLMVDYSSQEEGGRPGKHAESLESLNFQAFLHDSRPHDFDIMLEIKDKEKSAIHALNLAHNDPRLCTTTA